MFSRLAISLLCVFAVAGCGDTAGLGDLASEGGDTGPTGILSVVGPSSIVVAPRGTADIRVAYREVDGRAVSGIAVEFVLEGDAPAVSLTVDQNPQGPLTNDDGELTARLTVGTDAARFSVRANAEGTEPVYVAVEVLPSAVRPVSVEPRYVGLRSVTARTVTALPDADCELALSAGVTGEAVEQYDESDVSRTFSLGPGLRYAFVAWGRDATGSLLAQGCSELTVPVDPDPDLELQPVIVELLDRSFMLRGSYAVNVELDVLVSAKRASETAVRGGEALLSSDSTGEATYYLNAIDGAIRLAGKATQADALLAERMNGKLGESLQAEFAAREVGPRVFLSRLAGLLQVRGSLLLLRADYGVSSVSGVPMSFVLTGMQAATLGTAGELDFDDALLPMTNIDAAYDDARAVISVETLGVQLALGEYARRLLDVLDAAEPKGLLGLLEDASGCEELVGWAAQQGVIASACDAGCVRAACHTAIGNTFEAARSELATLDANHPSIGVRGDLFVYDGEDNDGIVDRLGATSFQGSWGKSPEAESADAVGADFSVVE